MAPIPAGYIISGAGEASANGEYINRDILINGMPSYTNGTGWYLYLATEIMGDPPASTWILSNIVTVEVPDLGMEAYYVFPFGGPIGTWLVGMGVAPAPSVEPVMEESPPNPLDPLPWPPVRYFPEPELYPDELDPAEPMPHLFDDDYALWVTISGAEKSEPVLRVAVRRTLTLPPVEGSDDDDDEE